MPFAVNNPRSFIKGDYWTGGAEAGVNGDQFYPIPESTNNRWQDPKANITVENEEVLNNTDNKSFFDPCPNGWSIPVKGWNGGFRGDFSESATGDITMNCQSNVEDDSNGRHRGSGRTYFPNGYLNERSNSNPQTCFFPYTGYIYFSSGIITEGAGFMWSASNSSGKNCYYFL